MSAACRLLFGAFGVALLAGCSSGMTAHGRGDSAQDLGSVPAQPESVTARWMSTGPDSGPFQPLLDSAFRVEQRLASAEQRAVAVCMAGRGQRYEPSAVMSANATGNQYGIIGAAEQRAGTYVRVATAQAADPNQAYLAAQTSVTRRAWSRALVGDGEPRRVVEMASGRAFSYVPDSCSSQAAASVYGPDFQTSLLEVQDESVTVVYRTQTDPRVVRAIDAWRACVTAAGLGTVTDLGDLRRRVLDGVVPPSGEQAVFVTDLRCEGSAGIHTVFASVQAENEALRVRDAPASFVRLSDSLTRDEGATTAS
jgi:hypothetical protein